MCYHLACGVTATLYLIRCFLVRYLSHIRINKPCCIRKARFIALATVISIKKNAFGISPKGVFLL